MGETKVYLDYNATAPARPEVIEAVTRAMSIIGNPNSVHRAGRSARAVIDAAREQVAALVNSEAANVIFTGGGTEADNLALKGFGKRRLLVAGTEHGAVLAPAMIHDPGCIILPVDADGLVSPSDLGSILDGVDEPALVSVMLANNETGVIQAVAELAAVARAHDALIHCDAVQAAGKIPIDIQSLGVDMLSLSAHKIGGPQGVGALVLSKDRAMSPQMIGGGQEKGRRSGTENVAGISGFGVAAEMALAHLSEAKALANMRDAMEQELRRYSNEVNIYGRDVARLPNTSCLTMPGVTSEIQVMSFDLQGIAISAGSACSSGKIAASHVLDAMGVAQETGLTAIRVSLGYLSHQQDVDTFVAAWKQIYEHQLRTTDAA